MLFVIAKEMFVREFFESSSNSLSLSLYSIVSNPIVEIVFVVALMSFA